MTAAGQGHPVSFMAGCGLRLWSSGSQSNITLALSLLLLLRNDCRLMAVHRFNPYVLQKELGKTPFWNSGELMPISVDKTKLDGWRCKTDSYVPIWSDNQRYTALDHRNSVLSGHDLTAVDPPLHCGFHLAFTVPLSRCLKSYSQHPGEANSMNWLGVVLPLLLRSRHRQNW